MIDLGAEVMALAARVTAVGAAGAGRAMAAGAITECRMGVMAGMTAAAADAAAEMGLTGCCY